MRNSDDEPSKPLRVGVEDSDDGATPSIKSIKIPMCALRGPKNEDDGTAQPLTLCAKPYNLTAADPLYP